MSASETRQHAPDRRGSTAQAESAESRPSTTSANRAAKNPARSTKTPANRAAKSPASRAAKSPAGRSAATRKKKRLPGWVPDQHGAWFMVTVPVVLGAILAGPRAIHVPIALTWWLGYFAFFAMSVWMRAKFNAKHRPPVLTYGAATVVAGLATLAMDWTLLVWAPVFAPFVAVAVFETWKRRPRSLASGEATVFAATLMFLVMVWTAEHPLHTWEAPWEHLGVTTWAVWGILTAYYFGSIPYVKTLIRNRGDRAWLVFSVLFHAAATMVCLAAAIVGEIAWLTPAVFAVATWRAWWMPHRATTRGTPWKPKQVGRYEVYLSIAIVAAAVWTWYL